jgi:predicted metal-binding protein
VQEEGAGCHVVASEAVLTTTPCIINQGGAGGEVLCSLCYLQHRVSSISEDLYVLSSLYICAVQCVIACTRLCIVINQRGAARGGMLVALLYIMHYY